MVCRMMVVACVLAACVAPTAGQTAERGTPEFEDASARLLALRVPREPLPEEGSSMREYYDNYVHERSIMIADARSAQDEPLTEEQLAVIDSLAAKVHRYGLATPLNDEGTLSGDLIKTSPANAVLTLLIAELWEPETDRSVEGFRVMEWLKGDPAREEAPHPFWIQQVSGGMLRDASSAAEAAGATEPVGLPAGQLVGAVWGMRVHRMRVMETEEASVLLGADGAAAFKDPRGRSRNGLMRRYVHLLRRQEPDGFIAEAINDAVQASDEIEPFIKHSVAMHYHNRAAWRARGATSGGAVSDEGWRVYRREMTRAAEEMEAALEIDPNNAELLDNVISFCYQGYGTASRSNDRRRALWKTYTQAVRHQADMRPAHQAMRVGMYPRWSGSIEDLKRLLLWQANVLPESNDARSVSFVTLMDLADETKELGIASVAETLADRSVVEPVLRALDRLIERARARPTVVWQGATSPEMYETAAAALEYFLGDAEGARERLERIDYAIDTGLAEEDRWKRRVEGALWAVAAETGPRSDEIAAAVALLPGGDESAALAMLEPGSGFRDLERRYIKERVDEWRVRRARIGGETLDIADLADPNRAFVYGTDEWMIEDGNLTVSTGGDRNWQALARDALPRWRFRVVSSDPATDIAIIWYSDRGSLRVRSDVGRRIWVDPNTTPDEGLGMVDVSEFRDDLPWEIEIETWDGSVLVRYNGVVTHAGRMPWMSSDQRTERRTIEFNLADRRKFTFDVMEFQRLNETPEWVGQEIEIGSSR